MLSMDKSSQSLVGSFIPMIDQNQGNRGIVAKVKSVSEITADTLKVTATFGVFGGPTVKTQ